MKKGKTIHSMIENIYSLTPLQEGMLFHSLLDHDSTSYIVQSVYELRGVVNEENIKTSLLLLAKKYDIFRTAIISNKIEKPRQVVLKNRSIEYDKYDISGLSAQEQQEKLTNITEQDVKRGFDFQKDSLIRVKLIQLNETSYQLIWCFHHIIMDGWCMSLVLGDFLHYYKRLMKGESINALEQKVLEEKSQIAGYSEYIKWIEKQNKEEGLHYWSELLADYDEIAEIKPVEKAEITEKQIESAEGKISNRLSQKLNHLAVSNQVTVNTIVEAAWGILLQKYNYTKDAVFGKVVSGRNVNIKGIEKAVGLFINTIPVRVRCDKDITIKETFQLLKEQGIENSYDYCSLADIQNLTPQGNHLIKTLFVFENYYQEEKEQDDEDLFQIEGCASREQTNYDLTIVAYLSDDNLCYELLYNPNKYTKSNIKSIQNNFNIILQQVIENSSKKVSEITMLSKQDKKLILEEFNQNETKLEDKPIIELFEEQVEKNPDQIAVIFENRKAAYQEINNKSNLLAHHLRELGIKPDDFIVIISEKRIELIEGILSILKAGGAYVPVDMSYPDQRIQYMLQDCKPKAVLVYENADSDQEEKNVERVKRLLGQNEEKTAVIEMSDYFNSNELKPNLQIVNTKHDLAYCIYTSGTTGQPKGSMIENKSVIRLVKNTNYIKLNESSVIMQTGSMSFDASTLEVWGTLLNGGCLVLSDIDVLTNTNKLKQQLHNYQVNTMWMTSTLFNQTIQSDQTTFDELTYLLIGGEKLSEDHVRILKESNKKIHLINGYGPTENTTFTTTYEIPNDIDKIPIGKPIANTKVYIMNGTQLCGIGIPGELCATGDGISRGYLNKEELTKEKFIDNPFGEGKMYRSGDLVRWLSDGNIDFIARIDEQVKIRGFRIEPGEIESALRKINGVKNAAVIVRMDSNQEKDMYAYVVLENGISIEEIKMHLKENLPNYMIPNYMMQLDAIPVTRNGKTDKKALPEIKLKNDTDYVGARNETEEIVCNIFKEILNLDSIGVYDNFFELGGHSLRATRLVNRIEAETGKRISLKSVFTHATVEQLAGLIKEKEKEEYIPIPKAGQKDYYPMSSTQKRTYFVQMLDGGVSYNIPQCLTLIGEINIENIKFALQKLLERHEILRTEFLEVEDEPVQRIRKFEEVKADFEYIEDPRTEELKLINSFIKPFDLSKAPLFRVRLVRRDKNHLLFIDMHHIIGDGMSLTNFMNEFSALYKKEDIQPLTCQYKDYSEWMRTKDLSKQADYWTNLYRDDIPVLELPYDYKRKIVQSHNGDAVNVEIESLLTDRIKKLAVKTGTTEYMIFMSAAMILLARYSRQEDIVIGSPVSGRIHKDTEQLMGMFANTLAMRAKPEANKKFHEFLGEVKECCLKAYENQEYPFEELIEALEVKRDIGRNPLFDVMLVMQNNESANFQFGDVKAEYVEQVHRVSKFDLTFNIEEMNRQFDISLEYCTDLFTDASAKCMLRRFVTVLDEITVNQEVMLSDISIITEDEKEKICNVFSCAQENAPYTNTIIDYFEEQVKKTPDAIAVELENNTLTYRELNERSNRLAWTLKENNINVDDFVAIIADRSIEMLIAVYAVIKAGGAYVPIDPEYPNDRIEYILSDCKPKAVLVYQNKQEKESLKSKVEKLLKNHKIKIPVMDLADASSADKDNNPPRVNGLNDLIYCIYTSGTTGRPKGVLVEHKGLVNHIMWWKSFYNRFDFAANMPLFSNFAFDFTGLTLYLPFVKGGKIIVYDQDIDIALMKILKNDEITIIKLTPGHMKIAELFKNTKKLPNLKSIVSGGELLTVETTEKFRSMYGNHIQICNEYGPTECTIASCMHIYDSNYDVDANVSIGKPIRNIQMYILNDMQLSGIGLPGEICIAGDCVARGYLNREELTEEKFIPNPFGEGKLYRTGDLAKWNKEGNIEYLGRIDEQVKVRGYRVELGEIESAILKVDNIKEAVAIVRKDALGDNVISAYMVSDKQVDISFIKNILRKELPEYMIPLYMMQIDRIPVTSNGKVNRKALPEIEITSQKVVEEPRNELEKKTQSIFCKVLGVANMGIHDNFFDMGGHSLKALKLLNRLEEETGIRIKLKEVFANPTVEKVAKLLENSSAAHHITIPKAAKKEMYVMSSSQKRMHIIHQLEGEGVAYNVPTLFEYRGDLDIDRLENAFQVLLHRHDILRTSFYMVDGKGYQKIEKEIEGKVEYKKTAKLNKEKRMKEIHEFIQPFHLDKAPLVRMKVVQTAKTKGFLFLDIHHIISDAITREILLKELFALYNGEAVEEVTVQYKDYSEWMLTRDIAKQENYWKEQFCDEIPVLNLPLDYARPQIQSFQGNRISLKIEKKTVESVDEIVKKTGTTRFMVLLSALMITLGKYSRQEDIVIGTPISGRTIKDTEAMLGMFVNTLALRGKPAKSKNVLEFLNEIKDTCLAGYENQEYPFEELVDSVKINRDMSRNPLFDVMFVVENNEQADMKLGKVSLKEIDNDEKNAKFDLLFAVNETKDGYALGVEYCTDLFKKASVENMLKHFEAVIKEITFNTNRSILEVSELSSQEKDRILYDFNQTDTDYPKDKSVAQLLKEQVSLTPDKIAVIAGNERVSYKELYKKADYIAKRLREYNVGLNDFVMIPAERSTDMIVGICAILLAGGAYVPLDLKYPIERIKFMIEDCEPKVILTAEQELPFDVNIPTIQISGIKPEAEEVEELKIISSCQSLAYCMYTSGTTGKPKGSLIEHKNIVRLVKNTNYLTLDETSVIMQTGSMSFDASTLEVWGALLNGGCLVLADTDVLTNNDKLKEYLGIYRVNTMWMTSTLFNQLIQNDNTVFDGLHYLLIGGEKLSEDHVRMLKMHNQKICLINGYGPTENTTFTTTYKIPNKFEKIPIGKPVANTKVYILNETKLCGIGVPGELCTSGDGVSRGYLNRYELTKEKFIPNPFGEGMLYRTGDLARWMEDGNIEYLGRIDDQVKIRGFRIELAEIENAIRKLHLIKDAAVIVKETKNGEKVLYAYLVSKEKLELSSLRDMIRQKLPEYMIPAHMMQIDQLPVTRNGKLDVRSLPDIEMESEHYIAPKTIVEKQVVKIYEEVLMLEKIGIKDSFFELGGHSLRATRVINMIEKEFGVRISLKDLFKNPTVEGVVSLLKDVDPNTDRSIPKAESKKAYKMSSSQKRMYVMNELIPNQVAYNVPIILKYKGELEHAKVEQVFQTLVKRHEVLRTVFYMFEKEGYQKVLEHVDAKVDYQEIYAASDQEQEAVINQFVRPFRLDEAPLMRMKIVKTKENEGLLMMDMHHIISDGMSMNLLLNEFSKLYEGHQLQELNVQYKDYSEWLSRQDLSAKETYWLEQFGDEVPVLDLPLDYPRKQIQSFHGNRIKKVIPDELKERIQKLASQTETTEYMILLSAWMITLGKYSRQEDIVIGSPISGRTHKDTENMLGMFVNTLAMRGKPNKNKTFLKFLNEMKDTCLKAYENQEYPFDELVEKVGIQRDTSRNPLFDVMFVLQNNEFAEMNLDGVVLSQQEISSDNAKFDLLVAVSEFGQGYEIGIDYCTDIFTESSVSNMINRFINILNETMLHPEQEIVCFNGNTEEEQERILHQFNNTMTAYPKEKTIAQLLDEQCKATPDHIAVEFEGKEITYQELKEQSDYVASLLRKQKVGKDDLVAIVTKRSIETIIGVCAVIKAGGAYVPIDGKYPIDRIKYIVKDCNPKVLLSKFAYGTNIPLIDVTQIKEYQSIEDSLEYRNDPNDLAYVMYTSGTTGNPKGVMVEQRNVIKLVKNADYVILNNTTNMLQTGQLAFDASTLEIWGTLLNGGCLHLITEEDLLNVKVLKAYLLDKKINTLFMTTSLFNQMVKMDSTLFDSLKHVMFGGEKASEESVSFIRKNNTTLKLTNGYGPTETTTFATCYAIPPIVNKIPIGKPISNTQVYIMNGMQLCGIGVPGELCIAGDGVARGYWNREALTKEKFIKNPFGEGRMYRSGDLARWQTDGTLEYLGRIDQQVKIHGYRIEPEEIENMIQQLPGVKEAVVMIKEDQNGEKAIYAYLTATEEINIQKTTEKLKKKLPHYMVPARMMQIETMPLTRNGKLDKRALPEIETISSNVFAEAETDYEKVVASVFQEVLGVHKVGKYDDFFELGGDSIKAMMVVSKLREYSYQCKVTTIMIEKTVALIAKNITENSAKLYSQEAVSGTVRFTPILKWFFEQDMPKRGHFNQSRILKANYFDKPALKKAFKDIILHHDMLRAVYRNDAMYIRTPDEGKLYDYEEYNVSNLSDKETKDRIYQIGCEIQSSINISEGPLVKVAVLKADKEEHLLIVIHHLVVDGVSWRILLEDFNTAYHANKNNEELTLPRKVASYQEWSENLVAYAKSDDLKKEEQYWINISKQLQACRIKGQHDKKFGLKTIGIEMNQEITYKLIHNIGRIYNLGINDILIAALGMAVKSINGQDKIAIDMEGHGRFEVGQNILIDRTVGWFTNISPVVIQAENDIRNTLLHTKKAFRNIPNKGIGYSIMKYIKNNLPYADNIDLAFNYLGEFDEEENESTEIGYSSYLGGENISKENKIGHNITINGEVRFGIMYFEMIYNTGKYKEDFIQKLADSYQIYLVRIVEYLEDAIKCYQTVITKKARKHTDNVYNFTEINDIDTDITFDDYLGQIMKRENYNGAVCISKNGQEIFCKAYGMADFENQIKNEMDTVFCCGSVTKQFTAAAIMLLSEQKKLDIDHKVDKYLPEYVHADKITIRQLLNMSSGIPDILTQTREIMMQGTVIEQEKTFLNVYERLLTQSFEKDDVIHFINNEQLLYTPGEHLNYSNSNYLLLGFIIEKMSGKTLGEFIQDHIIKPLGMKHTFTDHSAATASSYMVFENEMIMLETPVNIGGSGMMATTVRDLTIWLNAVLEGKILSKDSWKQCFQLLYDPNENANTKNYGFAWKKCQGGYYHDGNIAGFEAIAAVSFESNMTMVEMSNANIEQNYDLTAQKLL